MFCTRCGARFADAARFCAQCGAPAGGAAPPATPPMAPPPPPTPPPGPVPPPAAFAAPAAAAFAAPAAAAEQVIVLLTTTTARPPGQRPWHRDALITDRRVVVWKSGMGSILGKSLVTGAAAGLGAGLAGGSGAAVGAVLGAARRPGTGDARRLDPAAIDALVASKSDAFQAWYAHAGGVRLVKGGFLGDPKLFVDTPQGTLEVWVGGTFDELRKILPQVLGPRITVS